MARSTGTILENSFVRGLITEGTAINFPENACIDADNVIFDKKGLVYRRLGLSVESGSVPLYKTLTDSAVTSYVWETAGTDNDTTLLVLQTGRYLEFFKTDVNASLSSQKIVAVVDLDAFKSDPAADYAAETCAFATGKGFLFVTNPYCEPFYCEYSTTTESITATVIHIKIRDFNGVPDGLESTERPTTLSAAHKYNLLNQGWPSVKVNTGNGTAFPLDYFHSVTNEYPANIDIWWAMKDSNGNLNSSQVSSYEYGVSLAPKGFFILDAFKTDRSSRTTGGVEEKSSGAFRPSCCAFFAGRVWYSGVNTTGYVGEIYFSKIIEDAKEFGTCHQVNDPTSESLSDLLPTDGGVARILDAGVIHAMLTTQKALIIFASNGIWSIAGSEVSSFKADDFTINKVSTTKCRNKNTIIDAFGAPIFWTEEGIWGIGYEQGSFVVSSLSDGSIKTYLEGIPHTSKLYARAIFNRNDKTVLFLYNNTAPSTLEDRYTYTKALLFDLSSGAFSPMSFPSSTKTIRSAFPILRKNALKDNLSEITFTFLTAEDYSGSTKLLQMSTLSGTSYLDFNESDFSSYFVSGYRVHAEGNKNYQANFVVLYAQDINDAEAWFSGIWDYAKVSSEHNWTTPEKVYLNPFPNREYFPRKIKVRGWGKSLQYKISSVTGKPFYISGWSTLESANNAP